MNTEDARFVVAWMLSPSLEAASAVLGMGPGCVIRRAEQMRAAGVPLKDLGEINKAQTNDMQVSPLAKATSDETTTSYISLLKTDEQMHFYTKYTLGRDGGLSLAESVANTQALRCGDRGRASLASGDVEDAAFEAVAQLAVAPPPGFRQDHKRVDGYVARHIQHAVRSMFNKHFGRHGKRFGGSAPTNADGRVIEVASREPGPAECVDSEAELAVAQAREAEWMNQLERVMAALPGGIIPSGRPDRIATLQTFGEGKRQAIRNAAEPRFFKALAKHIRMVLKLDPLGVHDASGHERQAEAPIQAPNKRIAKPQPKLSASEIPKSIRQRLVPAATKSPEQRRAERFVIAWQTSSNAREAATRLGKPVKSVTAYARRLRMLGVTSLKALPTSPGPLVRGARALIPSAN